MKKIILFIALLASTLTGHARDGHSLWLNYKNLGKANVEFNISQKATRLNQATLDIVKEELHNYYQGEKVIININEAQPSENVDEYTINGNQIYCTNEISALHAAYALLREQAINPNHKPHLEECSNLKYRILNHWDNIDGSIERGYAGKSIFFPSFNPEIIKEYARANASIGINGSVLNNVNTQPKILTASYLNQVKQIADILRPYGIKVYLSINFGTPKALGILKTADPLDKKVIKWWNKKAKEIYTLIPDFGGFLVKASSEGQPGPNDYGRTHADGANMLADAVKPYGGIVVWRSFVYGANHKGEDRVMQAVSEFKQLDGKFHDNVILQSKNGPLDFQPREPYAPIFDNIKETPQMAELQITQEYTGQSKHLVYLAPMWQEFFSFVNQNKLEGVAGVANIGNDKNWCGHDFSQANWYAFGRMLWNSTDVDNLNNNISDKIAEEWILQTFGSTQYSFINSVKEIMMTSREACVNYMMPLGLHHIFKFDHHYGPEPDGYIASYPLEWCPVYYHKADAAGIGFDRTKATGSGATTQYREPYCSQYEDIKTCPEEYLLWFHHVAWDYKMKDGNTLWQNLVDRYYTGAHEVDKYCRIWQEQKPYVDGETWNRVNTLLNVQKENAWEWVNTCLGYFSTFSKKEWKQNK